MMMLSSGDSGNDSAEKKMDLLFSSYVFMAPSRLIWVLL